MDNQIAATPADELQARVDRLQTVMHRTGVDGALIVQKTDLYYFAATSQQGWLYIPAEGLPLLMIFKDCERARAESPLDQVISLASPKKIPAALAAWGISPPGRCGLELDVVPANLYFQFAALFKGVEIVDISAEIRLIRAVKSAYELALIREAAARADQLFARVPELLESGRSEVALAGAIEGYARSLGHQGIVRMRLWGSELFYGHLLSGPDAAVPSYLASPTGGVGVSPSIGQGAGFRIVGRNEPILVDFVFAWRGYLVDQTRIFAIGSLPDALVRTHDALLEVEAAARSRAVPGAVSGELYEAMVAHAGEKGLAAHFMGAGERRIRFTGHGVGLELDEFPFLAKDQTLPLAEGMVIALEPKAVLPGIGVVGTENTHIVTGRGLERLSALADTITLVDG